MRLHRRSMSLVAVFGACLASCGGSDNTAPTPTPTPTPTPVPPVASISLSGPTQLTGPGVVRIAVDIRDARNQTITGSVATTITTTGPFGASMEVANQPSFRVLSVGASAPGTGSITVSAGGKSGSISLTAVAVGFQSISAAYGYACGIAVDQHAWCWGGNLTYELGLSTVGKCSGGFCQYGGNDGNPTPLPVNDGRTYSSLAVSGNSCAPHQYDAGLCGATCGLTTAAEAVCWGVPTANGPYTQTQVGAGKTITAVSVSSSMPLSSFSQACGIVAGGQAFCFAKTDTAIAPGMTFTSLAIGHVHSCGVASGGDVYCWGSNLWGNLGIGTVDTLSHPTPERVQASVKFTSVSVGDYSSCALDTTGVVYCWGTGYSASGVAPPPNCRPSSPAGVPCEAAPRPLEGGGQYVAFARAESRPWVCGLTGNGAVDCWTAFNVAPSAVSLQEPLINITVGATIDATSGAPRFSGCGVSLSHVGYCWGSDFKAFKIGQ